MPPGRRGVNRKAAASLTAPPRGSTVDGMSGTDRRTFLTEAAAGAALLAVARHARAAGKVDPERKGAYAEAEKRSAEAVGRLQEWIRQPTINSQGIGVKEGAELMARLARDAGFQKVELVPTRGAPVVFGRLDAGAKRTLALYFMYDVKQVNESEWASPPFAAKLVDLPDVGKVVMGRGAVNQKGPEAAFLAALHAIRGAGKKLPVNLVLVAEGEEEDGSPHFADAVRRADVQAALAGCQAINMPSASQGLDGTVDIALGSKGVIQVELRASGARWGRGPKERDIHSGMRPLVDSPVYHLVLALASLVTPDGNDPAIDGLEAKVRPLSELEKKLIADAAVRQDEKIFKEELSVDHWARDLPYREALERLCGRPTVNIQGLVAGYQGPAGKTILPKEGLAKLDLRIVPDLKAAEVIALLRAHLDKRGFGDIEIVDQGSYDPNTTAYDSLGTRAQIAVYRAAGLEPVVWPRSGGSWPGYLFTEGPLRLSTMRFGMGYGRGAHSKDEIFVVEPKAGVPIEGMAGAVRSHIDLLYTFAQMA
jgi:acetylornithine deacetylase/succinyl-diaminopimelate desuccinylase-like protein